MKLYAATTNAGKLRDFAWASEALPPGARRFEVRPLRGLEEIAAPEEDGATFEANARLKAQYYSGRRPGLWVIADDSGLEVDALGGRPGIRSARFAGDLAVAEDAALVAGVRASAGEPHSESADERNNAALLGLMGDFPAEKRTAQYRCVLALARDGCVETTADGVLAGRILPAGRGAGGFGYDPLFWIEEVGMTMAEIDPATRLRFSHRARALRALLEQLRGRLG